MNGASCTGGDGPGEPGSTVRTRRTGRHRQDEQFADAVVGRPRPATVTGYRVYEGSAVRATVTGTSATITGLAACSAHTYTVPGVQLRRGSPPRAPRSPPPPPAATRRASPGSRAVPLHGLGRPAEPVHRHERDRASSGSRWRSSCPTAAATRSGTAAGRCTGGADEQAIAQIRAAGGDVLAVVRRLAATSSGRTAPPRGARRRLPEGHQRLRPQGDRHRHREQREFENAPSRQRMIDALKIVKRTTRASRRILTFGTATGARLRGTRLINRAAALRAERRQLDDHAVQLRRRRQDMTAAPSARPRG